ncbi:TolB-like translocation protein [Phytohabitans aurantiacus]|uniref:Lipoprotein LpqB beta-propeller domain-containing protein n=1 Tax=Phytohabitans aurantiacus TaxID=3016789 RepID=A0ABQ5R505_9ACTN|nr:hypothetical protein [Phytohabitans aurantiacus]GLI01869.1 hypothetical protein Pa4123_71460 [Phytohabitans aurantiacus]
MTSPRLSRALEDLAAEAGSYASVDAVLAETGRRRRRRTVIAAAAAVLAVALGGGVVAALPKKSSPVPMPLPVAAWPVPESDAQTLPSTGAVGRAAYAYTTLGGSYLVTRDARLYILPNPGLLSPDGRWLAYGLAPDRYLVRDLTGDTVWPVTGGMGGLEWSADSRWLLLTDGTEPRQKWYLRLDTRDGAQHTSDVPYGFADGVLPSGEIVYVSDPFMRPAGADPVVTRYDPATGAKTDITLDVPEGVNVVEPNEQRLTVLLGPGNSILIGVYDAGGLSALLEYQLSDPKYVTRHDVRAPRGGETLLIAYNATDGLVVGFCDDTRTMVALVDPGRFETVLTLPGRASVSLASSDR